MKNIEINYQSENSYRGKAVLWLLEKGVPIHAKLNAHRVAWNLSSDDFLNLLQVVWGILWVGFIKHNTLNLFQKQSAMMCFMSYLVIPTNVIDEAGMQFFLWGNGKPSFFTVGTCIITTILFPNHFQEFKGAYQKGKQATSIRDWNFKALLNENLNELQNKIFNLK
jgi:hypothetical protein